MVSGSGLLAVMVILPFIGALVPGLMIRAGRDACAMFTAVPTILALVFLGRITKVSSMRLDVPCVYGRIGRIVFLSLI